MKVAIIQMTSKLDYKENLSKIESMLDTVSSENIEAVFLPECFYSMSNGQSPSPHLIEDENLHYQNIKNLSIKYKMAFIGGSVATRIGDSIVNRSYNFDAEGNELGRYDKIHLFSCNIQRGDIKKKINEGDIYTPGTASKLINLKQLAIGLGICFDLRYSEMALAYRKQGANLLTYASAFTVPTGKAHWHTLVRARAIESQCFVIASAQWGANNDKIQTYGHSLIVDPWGEILIDAEQGESIHTCELDLDKVDLSRSQVIMGRE
ncbi:nitrilase-related carbon-nitrogen hydrolase [Halobacteriovorax sp. HLS]|uniref:nitrilase-related carbon-nitrogen hydrolase n=1 Tax=Halobacteriovorax sp. HLS TaxID=2234000 RepID=UPI000FD9B748|nr:nitrilase-related carbon-nitrogen hydrolase [Halobacteriovorax sp. HLS]